MEKGFEKTIDLSELKKIPPLERRFMKESVDIPSNHLEKTYSQKAVYRNAR